MPQRLGHELTRTLTGESRGSLLHAVDRTLTAAGGRLLSERLAAPLSELAAIDARLDLVDWFPYPTPML